MARQYRRSWKISKSYILSDSVVIVLSLYFSLIVRIPFEDLSKNISQLNHYLPIILSLRLLTNWFVGVYEIMWRYISARDAFIIVQANFISSAFIIAFSFLISDWFGHLPRTVYIIDFMTVTLGLLGLRVSRRIYWEKKRLGHSSQKGVRTIIYGAGALGHTLAMRILADVEGGIILLGFIDDDPSKKSLRIAGLPVLGNSSDLNDIVRDYQIEQVIISIHGFPGDRMREIMQACYEKGVRVKMLGSLSPNPNSQKVELVRDVSLSDLLNRPQKKIDTKSLFEMVQGKVVLVTGAGGSIGSEIARQIWALNPHKLLILDHSELNLYKIDKELRVNTAIDSKVIPLLIDIKDQSAISHAMQQYFPQIVFHAAAYKHVHLVEKNPYEAITNNVLGTLNLLKESRQIDVETFVLISTDKAVNPVGIMGATKRVCELLTTIFALQTGRRYCSVRFGNVLGSSGSLIPLLQEQIRAGGPVTITHKDMTRFFMLIPEAVALVLKAATIARPADIKVLKMGDPVKIVDIARSLIFLMGASEKEIPIVFTGLRPGEKLFEELYIRGDELKTEHPDILTLPNGDSHLHSRMWEIKSIMETIERMLIRAQERNPLAILDLRSLANTTTFDEQNLKRDQPDLMI